MTISFRLAAKYIAAARASAKLCRFLAYRLSITNIADAFQPQQ